MRPRFNPREFCQCVSVGITELSARRGAIYRKQAYELICENISELTSDSLRNWERISHRKFPVDTVVLSKFALLCMSIPLRTPHYYQPGLRKEWAQALFRSNGSYEDEMSEELAKHLKSI
jgi:hypothetical protein